MIKSTMKMACGRVEISNHLHLHVWLATFWMYVNTKHFFKEKYILRPSHLFWKREEYGAI